MARTFVLGAEHSTSSDDKPSSGLKPSSLADAESQDTAPKETMMKQAMRLVFCVAGLQGSYITWGVLQEQIMTQAYGQDEDGNDIHFRNSQYLVFINRVLALAVAILVLNVTRQPSHGAPTYRYSFASMSNIMSSWCQYEALKYVSFPTQVLAKSSKMIPVMIMGKFVDGKTYPTYEYICAAAMSLGVSIFMFSKAEQEGNLPEEGAEQETSISGIVLLIGYLVFDR